jgi:hypothetical protein
LGESPHPAIQNRAYAEQGHKELITMRSDCQPAADQQRRNPQREERLSAPAKVGPPPAQKIQ